MTIGILHLISPRASTYFPPTTRIETVPNQVSKVVYSPPARLEIASLGVGAPVVAVGLTPDNAMDIEKDPAKTAWYKLGPNPGERGSAVIAGHYGWTDGRGSVFNDLRKLLAGDIITVQDEKRITHTFVVRETRQYDRSADTTEVFQSTDGKAHLNLITCDGSWDEVHQTYSDRFVVFSDLVAQ